MTVFYFPQSDELVLVILKTVKYIKMETEQLSSFEITGGLAGRFLSECDAILICEL